MLGAKELNYVSNTHSCLHIQLHGSKRSDEGAYSACLCIRERRWCNVTGLQIYTLPPNSFLVNKLLGGGRRQENEKCWFVNLKAHHKDTKQLARNQKVNVERLNIFVQ